MTFIPPWENISEKKICRISGQEFFVTDKDMEFYDKISPIFWGKKYSIPSPTLCPDERQKRRLCFRNERKLYKRKCDLSGKEIISIYSPDKPYVVYDQKVWWGDDWSPMNYGRSFDFERPFFPQFSELMQATPRLNLFTKQCENCDYTNHTLVAKDCYLCVGTTKSESCYYDNFIRDCRDVMDATFCFECENVYQWVNLTRCYTCYYAKDSINCRDCLWIERCENCTHCIGCFGLKNKEYHVYNKPVSRESYEKTLENAKNTMWLPLFRSFDTLKSSYPVKPSQQINCEWCVGDQIENGKNSFFCFDSQKLENSKYIYSTPKGIECMDAVYTAPGGIEYCYEVGSTVDVTRWLFTFYYWNGSGGIYAYGCQDSDNIFGCTSLKRAHHCVMNTSYSTQEYETLCGKIIDHMRSTGEWGEYFPHGIAHFGYNETVAQEYFPMTETEVISRGWKWYDGESKNTYIWNHYAPLPIAQYNEKIVGYETATKNINEVLGWIIECAVTKKPFKIIKQELVFYIENWIPIPTKHPDQRHKERMDLRNPRKFFERTCSECKDNILTTYSPDKPEKVVCEKCYHKLVY